MFSSNWNSIANLVDKVIRDGHGNRFPTGMFQPGFKLPLAVLDFVIFTVKLVDFALGIVSSNAVNILFSRGSHQFRTLS